MVDLNHWKFEKMPGFKRYANIYSPTLMPGDKIEVFPMGREIYKEFRILEDMLKQEYIGWMSWTKLKNDHIMLFLAKAKAKPLRIDIKEKIIWFYKNF